MVRRERGRGEPRTVGLCSPCHDAALEEKEIDEEQEAWIRKVRYELNDKAWATDLRRGRREALSWKRRILVRADSNDRDSLRGRMSEPSVYSC